MRLPIATRLPIILTLLAAGTAWGQEFAQIRIGARPTGAKYFVDGVEYQTTQSFIWAQGSKHTLSIYPVQASQLFGQRFTFTGWESNGKTFSSLPEIVVTADGSIKELIAAMQQEYQLRLFVGGCPDPKVQCAVAGGKVTANGIPYFGDVDLYAGPAAEMTLQAEPMPGFVFSRWSGVPTSMERAPIITLKLDRPTTVRAHFDGASPVLLKTSPEYLHVLVDRAPTRTPVQLDWAQGVPKLLAAVSPQRDDKGNLFVFQGFEGLPEGQNVTYTPKVGQNSIVTLTARFVQGAAVTVYTEPAGLRVKVNGQELFDRNYAFYAAVDSKVTLEAPAEQFDSRGRKYVFAGWSHGGDASQSFALTRTGFTSTARYRLVPRLVIESSPSARMIQVDGNPCRTPCAVDRDREQNVMVTVPDFIPVTADSRYQFAGWGDNNSASRVFVIDAELRTVTARYDSAHRLALAAYPAAAATFKLEPASPDGFYRSGATVNITATAKPGYRFRRWEGDLEGTFAGQMVQMTSTRYATANFDVVPFADPAGVQNGAAPTPLPGVAPGSVGAIVGLNLAGDVVQGPASPLAQTLGGVVVRMGLRLMPLFWVSPERIEFQVPSDLEPGAYKLVITRPGQADVEANLELVRNNPGLFIRDEKRLDGGLPRVRAHRADGSEVTPENPARRGEEITLLATGCGSYDLRTPDGFALPGGLTFRLQDTVEVMLGGEQIVTPTFAGGHGPVGVNAIRFKVPESASGEVKLQVRVNDRLSNETALPVE